MESAQGWSDPRGKGFRRRWPVAEVVAWLEESLATRWSHPGVETVPLAKAAGRVLTEAVVSQVAVPRFARAAMDGYAVRGEDTFGADPTNPLTFRVVGRSRPGVAAEVVVGSGEAVAIATGAPLPPGADAVVPVEATRLRVHDHDHAPSTASLPSAELLVEVVEPTPPGRHVGRIGEDVAPGEMILEPGRWLRPQDLGVLSALGWREVLVRRRPRVTILATGPEILPVGSAPSDVRIPDMNSPMLAALVERDGGHAEIQGPLADDRHVLAEALARAANRSEFVIVSGGSSTGPEDHLPSLVAELGSLPFHGLALRPAGPTGLGTIGSTPILLAPGNPVSCLCAYDLLGSRVVRRLAGWRQAWAYRATRRPLTRNLVSVLGRLDYARVRFDARGGVEPLAISGASILSSTVRADGFTLIAPHSEGAAEGTVVTVWRYDPTSSHVWDELQDDPFGFGLADSNSAR